MSERRTNSAGAPTRLTLVRNPGTPQQRAVRVVDIDRPYARQHAVEVARHLYGEDVLLGWLNQDTRTTTPITGQE